MKSSFHPGQQRRIRRGQEIFSRMATLAFIYTAYFLGYLHTFHPCSRAPHGSRCCRTCRAKRAFHPHVITCLTVRCISHPLNSSSLSSVSTSCPISSPSQFCSSSSMWSELPSNITHAHSQNEESGLVAIQNPLTRYEPKQLDNFHYSETTERIF